jgi:hypothetical protein
MLMSHPIGSMYGIYDSGILMVNVTIYSIHGSYGYVFPEFGQQLALHFPVRSLRSRRSCTCHLYRSILGKARRLNNLNNCWIYGIL